MHGQNHIKDIYTFMTSHRCVRAKILWAELQLRLVRAS